MTNSGYVIRGGAEGRRRLKLLDSVMGPTTRALIAQTGIGTGARCLDVGCGGGDVSFELARVVGATGRVTGVDKDSAKIELARGEAAEQGLSNVDFEVVDVAGWQPGESFDLVYCRFLLSHLADPGGLLGAMYGHLGPGGVMVAEDIDFRGHFAEPPCAAMDRYVELYSTSVGRHGGDANLGPRLPALFRGAGLADVRMNMFQPVASEGGIKLLTLLTLENIADAVIGDGLATGDELGGLVDQLRAFAEDPRTIHGGPRVFQVWGRRAADTPG